MTMGIKREKEKKMKTLLLLISIIKNINLFNILTQKEK